MVFVCRETNTHGWEYRVRVFNGLIPRRATAARCNGVNGLRSVQISGCWLRTDTRSGHLDTRKFAVVGYGVAYSCNTLLRSSANWIPAPRPTGRPSGSKRELFTPRKPFVFNKSIFRVRSKCAISPGGSSGRRLDQRLQGCGVSVFRSQFSRHRYGSMFIGSVVFP